MKTKTSVFKMNELKKTLLPDCGCETRRVMVYDGVVYCGECGDSYGTAGAKCLVLSKIEFIKDE